MKLLLYLIYKVLPVSLRLRISFLLNDKLLVGITAFVLKNKKILLVKNTYQYHWSLPGGYIKKGESIAVSIERELREEVGLKVKMQKILNIKNNANGIVDIVVICNVIGGKLISDGKEVENAAFFDVDNITEEVLNIHIPYLNIYRKLLTKN